MTKPRPEGFCSKCLSRPKTPYGRWCKECRNAHSRAHRQPLSGLAKAKDAARSYANVYKKRGLLVPQPCERCGAAEVEMHHPDYSQPLLVQWLCASHHQDHHKA